MSDLGAREIVWTPDRVARLWDYYGTNRAYAAQYFSQHSGAAILGEVDARLPLAGREVVDFGCGPGFMLAHLLGRGVACRGLDFSRESVATAQRRFGDHPLFRGAVHVEKMPLPIADGAVDLMMLVEVVEHLLDDQVAPTLAEITRVVRPGGDIVVTVPHAEDLEASKVLCPECGAVFHRWQHQRSFTPATLSTLFRGAGFAEVYCAPTTFAPRSALGLLRRLRRRVLGRPEPAAPFLIYMGRRGGGR